MIKLLKIFLLWRLLTMMPSLPTVGADTNTWGTGLNAFLSVAHDPTTGNLLDSAIGKATFNFQTGTTYTLVNSDAGKVVSMSNAAANTLTVPADASMSGGSLPIGTSITLRQGGVGQTTVVAGGGATLVSRGTALKLAGQYAYATLLKVSANTWELSGDISA